MKFNKCKHRVLRLGWNNHTNHRMASVGRDLKDHPLEIQHPDSVLCQDHVPWHHKLNPSMIVTAETASNVILFIKLFCTGEIQAQ